MMTYGIYNSNFYRAFLEKKLLQNRNKCTSRIMALLWMKRPAFILTVASVAFVGFIILPVVAAIQNHRYDVSSIGDESDITHRGTEFAADASSMVPSGSPSTVPSNIPSDVPSAIPSAIPSTIPSATPSTVPSSVPSSIPSDSPTSVPTDFITNLPTTPIAAVGSDFPSIVPTQWVTPSPTTIDEMIDVRRRLRKKRVLLN